MATQTPEPSLPAPARIPAWVKNVVPVLVSALILYYYFHDQDWKALWASAARANLWLAVAAIVIPQVLFWFLEVLIVERHIQWFHGPFPFRTYFWVRGAIYILMFINTALGGGGVLLYTQRKARITWTKLAGIILFRIGLMLWALSVIMIPLTLAMHHYGLMEKARINVYVWWGFLIFGLLYFINGWMTWHHGTHFGLSRLVVRDRNSEFWTAFRIASKRQWYLTWAMILPPLAMTVVGLYFLALAFNIHIPWIEFMVVGPLMLIIIDLPIAFAGFGTATMGWTLFFGSYGAPEDIAALTLFLPFARSACRGVIGLVSLRPALQEIGALFQPGGEESSAGASDSAAIPDDGS